jgi:outer membrane protein assembly factor BamB
VQEKNVRIQMLAIIALSMCCLRAAADNWPHWRGVGGNGIAAESASPPTEWSVSKNVKWKVPVPGRGSSSPVIWEDRIYITTAVPIGSSPDAAAAGSGRSARQSGRSTGRPQFGRRGEGGPQLGEMDFQVLCYDKNTGEQIWGRTAVRATPHQGTHSTNGFASASPCTDGTHLYAHFGSRGLFCYSMDGDLIWKREDLGKMETRNSFGEGSSPTLAGDKIIVPWDHEGPSYLLALDKATGKTVWKTDRDEPTNWSTPLIIEHEGRQQIVMNGQNFARAYDLESGKELWRCTGQTDRPAASAVAADGLVFVGSGFRGAFMGAFRPGGNGDIEGTGNVAWTIGRDTPDIASPVLTNGRLYFHKAKSGVLTCVDAATGKVLFGPSRLPGLSNIYASPIAAGGHIYLTGRSGTTVVIKDADQLEIVATNSVGETVDATPAPVGNELIIRGENHLFCIAD